MARDFAKAFYKSTEWSKVREYVMMRDKYLCTMCGKPSTLVHHIRHLTPFNIDNPNITLNADNLTSLCKDCHYKVHRGEHGKGRGSKENYEYHFDENGMLIKKTGIPLGVSQKF